MCFTYRGGNTDTLTHRHKKQSGRCAIDLADRELTLCGLFCQNPVVGIGPAELLSVGGDDGLPRKLVQINDGSEDQQMLRG